LRSQNWFDDPSKVDMVAFHLERVLASGYSLGELQSGKPVIGIAQTGSDITPCNRHHRELAARVRDGIRTAGGVAFEFPIHPIQETLKRPTAALDRNLQYLASGRSGDLRSTQQNAARACRRGLRRAIRRGIRPG
jgi:dihydroxy-acid dehydratase